MNNKQRADNRLYNQMRSLTVIPHVFEYAQGSVLIELGKTKVLCAVSMQAGVPSFLRGKQTGWLTAEYAMLPNATKERTTREIATLRKNGRAVEIGRLIGRVFRAVTSLELIGEQTITIDCDVLQADGGTRTASITGACIALMLAQERWLARGIIKKPILTEQIAAVSIGVHNGNCLVDPTFEEDALLDGDFNFVLSKSDKLLEIQGGAEKNLVDWAIFDTMHQLARASMQQLFAQLALISSEHVPLSTDKSKSIISDTQSDVSIAV